MAKGRCARLWEQLSVLRLQTPLAVRMLAYLAVILLVVFIVMLIGALSLHNWALAYNLLVSNTNPDDPSVSVPALGYLLSVTGWLAVPALIGAWTGEVVGTLVEATVGPPLVESLRQALEDSPSGNGDGGGTP